ncbi:MAG: 1-acyl-sn-glycerol-3-phosphate acyltransferase [Flavobacteriaceae bacterium]
MAKNIAHFIYYKLLGWTFEGPFPDVSKCVVIVAPHTSWLDFFLGLLIRRVLGKDFHFVGKKSLFNPPFGWYFRWLGGAPVDRSKSSDTVSAIADIFHEKSEFRLALAPEGTRKKVSQWKSGYYYIAQNAGVPIIMVAFDYGRKQIKVSDPQYPSGDYENDRKTYERFFKGVEGYVADNSYHPD